MSTSNPLSARHARGFSVLRALFCGVLLTALVAGCLYLHHTALDFFRARMLDDGSKTIAWLTKQLSFALPFVVICLFHAAVYGGRDPRDGSVRREMFWEVALVAVLVYAVLLPYLSSVSEALHTNALAAGEKIPQTEGKVDQTLVMELHEWFVRLSIPMAVLFIYHSARAYHEIKHPEELEDEIPLTVEEYEAMRAQTPLVEGVTLTAESPVEEDIPTAAPDPLGEAPHE